MDFLEHDEPWYQGAIDRFDLFRKRIADSASDFAMKAAYLEMLESFGIREPLLATIVLSFLVHFDSMYGVGSSYHTFEKLDRQRAMYIFHC